MECYHFPSIYFSYVYTPATGEAGGEHGGS